MKFRPHFLFIHYPFGSWSVLYFMLSAFVGIGLAEFDTAKGPMPGWATTVIGLLANNIPELTEVARSYHQFPESALLVLAILWVTFPIQLGMMYWIIGRPGILHDYYLQWGKYPIRAPLAAVAVSAATLVLILYGDATSNASLDGPRSGMFSNMTESTVGFALGAAFSFFVLSIFGAFLVRHALSLLRK